jgi:hypothetical protein
MKAQLARSSGLWICSAAIAAAIWWFAGLQTVAAEPAPPPKVQAVPNGLCLKCHGQPGLTVPDGAAQRTITPIDAVAFTASAHGGQTCIACHGDQSLLPHPALVDGGTVKVAATCQTCHQEAYDGYLEGPHGTMAELHDPSGPTCSNCHGNVHATTRVAEWTQHDRAQVCAGCHTGAGTGFLGALSHKAASPGHMPIPYFAGRFLTVLAAGSLAFGIIHVELELLRWIVRRWRTGSRRERWEST